MRSAAQPRNIKWRRVLFEFGCVLAAEDECGAFCLLPTGSRLEQRDGVTALMRDFGVPNVNTLQESVATLIRSARAKDGRVDEQWVRQEWQRLRRRNVDGERCKVCGCPREPDSRPASESSFWEVDLCVSPWIKEI